MKRISGIWLVVMLLSGNLLAETSAYQTILQYARIKQLKQYVEKEQLLYALINRYIEETGRAPADKDTLVAYFDLPETTTLFDSFAKNVGDGKVVFVLENNSTVHINNVLGNLNTIYGTEVGEQLLDYYRKASDRSAVASVTGDNNVSYPVSESAKGVLRIHSGLDAEGAVMLSQKEFAELQSVGMTEEELARTYYVPVGKGNVDVYIWQTGEGWKNLGSIWDINKGEILVENEADMETIVGFKGMKALLIDSDKELALEYVHTGDRWIQMAGGGSGDSGLDDLNLSALGGESLFVGHATFSNLLYDYFDSQSGSTVSIVASGEKIFREETPAKTQPLTLNKRNIAIDDVGAEYWIDYNNVWFDGTLFGANNYPVVALEDNVDNESDILYFAGVLTNLLTPEDTSRSFYIYTKGCNYDLSLQSVADMKYSYNEITQTAKLNFFAKGLIHLADAYDCLTDDGGSAVVTLYAGDYFIAGRESYYKYSGQDYWSHDEQVAQSPEALSTLPVDNREIVARSRSLLQPWHDFLSTFDEDSKVADLTFHATQESDCSEDSCYYPDNFSTLDGYQFKYLKDCEDFPDLKHRNCFVDYEVKDILFDLNDPANQEQFPSVFIDGTLYILEGESYVARKRSTSRKSNRCIAVTSGSSLQCVSVDSLPKNSSSEDIVVKDSAIVIQNLERLYSWKPENATRIEVTEPIEMRFIYKTYNSFDGYWLSEDRKIAMFQGSIKEVLQELPSSVRKLIQISQENWKWWYFTQSQALKRYGEEIVIDHFTQANSCSAGCQEKEYCLIGDFVAKRENYGLYTGLYGDEEVRGKLANPVTCEWLSVDSDVVDAVEGGYAVSSLQKQMSYAEAKRQCAKLNMSLPDMQAIRKILSHPKGSAWTGSQLGEAWKGGDLPFKSDLQQKHYVKCVYEL